MRKLSDLAHADISYPYLIVADLISALTKLSLKFKKFGDLK
jgi:hypothetical protein